MNEMTDLLATPVKCTTGRCKGRNVMTRNPDGVCSRHPKGNWSATESILGDLLLEGDELNDGPVRGVIVRRWPPGSQDWRWIRLTIETDNGRQQVVHLLREARYYAHRRTTLPDDLATTPEFAIEEARRQADHSQ